MTMRIEARDEKGPGGGSGVAWDAIMVCEDGIVDKQSRRKT